VEISLPALPIRPERRVNKFTWLIKVTSTSRCAVLVMAVTRVSSGTKYGLVITSVCRAAWTREANSFRLFSFSKPEPPGNTWQSMSPQAWSARVVSGAAWRLSRMPVSAYQSVMKAASSWAAMACCWLASSCSPLCRMSGASGRRRTGTCWSSSMRRA
jgi:hypothetical protein